MLRMQKISESTLNRMLVMIRNLDKDSHGMLHFSDINDIIKKFELPIVSSLQVLNKKFENEANPGFSNYEQLVR